MAVHRILLTPEQVLRDFAQVSGELLHFDADRGVVLWADAPYPVMLLWSPRLYEFLAVLEGIMQYLPARGICRQVGYRSGFDGAHEARRALQIPEASPDQTLVAMPRVLAGAGWGLSELVYDEGSGSIDWTFPHGSAVGLAAAEQGGRTLPACAFYEGFAAGWVEGSVGLRVEFDEVECVGRGDDRCRFESRNLL